MVSVFSLTKTEFEEEVFAKLGKGRVHAGILYSHWFRQGTLDGVEVEPQARALVDEIVQLFSWELPEVSVPQSEGELSKFLLKFSDGLESESVKIPMQSGVTLCISSQVGCKMGCAFCFTGKMGLVRHLTAAEIVQQVFVARHVLGANVRNIVFMGMGEPLDNYEAVKQAIAVLTDPSGLGLGYRRITVSTSGLAEGILKMADEMHPALNLAVSVNAPTDEIRRKIMPVNKQWDMAELKAAMQTYQQKTGGEILVEYVLLAGKNDSIECAELLGKYLEGISCKVNVIPYNSNTRSPFAPPVFEVQEAFVWRMRELGYQTLLRGTKGDQIQAACGQLGNLDAKKRLALVS